MRHGIRHIIKTTSVDKPLSSGERDIQFPQTKSDIGVRMKMSIIGMIRIPTYCTNLTFLSSIDSPKVIKKCRN